MKRIVTRNLTIAPIKSAVPKADCSTPPANNAVNDLEEPEEMFILGPARGMMEWGGPTRGGARPEPTRYGDWERKGRASDF